MSVLDRKLRRDLWQNKSMLLAVVAIVAVGVGCLSGFLATSRNLESARSSYYQKTFLADFWVDLKKAPLTALPELLNIPGVASLRARLATSVMLDMEGVDRPISGQLISLPPQRKDVINNVILMSGTYFTPMRRNEVLVNHDFATARNIGPGDTLRMVIHGERRELYVVGTAISSEFVYLMPPGSIVPEPADYGIFYVKRQLAEDAMGFQGACNSLVGFLTPEARNNPQAVLDKLSAALKPYGVFATTPLALQASNLALSSELAGLSTMATMMPLIFLSVAALVLNVLMTRLAEQQRTIVGTLKALGYGNRKIRAHFLKVGFIVGLCGGIAGCVLGYFMAAGLTETYKSFFTFPKLANMFYPNLMLLSVAIALFFGLLGTLRGVGHVTRLNPAEAMHEQPPTKGGSIFLEKFPWLWRGLGFRWQLSLRNLFRNRVRSLVGVFAAAMGTALLVCTFGMVDSLQYMADFQFEKILLSDFKLTFREEMDYGAVYEIASLPGVVRVEPLLEVACDFVNGHHSKKGRVLGLVSDAQMTVPRDTQGRAVAIPHAGLLMSRRMASILDVDPGDRVTIIPTKGLQDPRTVRVARIIDSMFGLSVYADFDFLNAQIHESDAVSALQLRTRMTPAELRVFLHQCKRYPQLAGIGNRKLQQKLIQKSFVDKLGAMAYPLIFFGGIIFFGSILNASLIGILERKREIATYRVLGYSALEVGNLLLRENILVNVAGILVGLPLGWWMLDGMAKQYQNDMYSMPCVINPGSWIISIVLAVVFVLLCQVVIQRSILKLNWNEALSMKE